MNILKEAEYPFPKTTPKFLGTVIQKYRLRGGKPSRGFQHWVNEINNMVTRRLVSQLKSLEMVFTEENYKDIGIAEDYCLATIPDFNTLIATSQETQTPVFSLTPEKIQYKGTALKNMMASVDKFHDIFSELAIKINQLIEYDDDN